jgi:phage I-like protein
MALADAICDRALAPGGGAPEWVHLLPAGQMTGRDGRQFELADPAALCMDFQSRGVDLPIDYEHQNDRPEAKLTGPVPAAGWIKELRGDETGLWGRVEWTTTAREMIGKREYRYLSPSFLFHQQSRQIVRLKGAGLVHHPNLHLTALANEEPLMPDNTAPDTAKPESAGLLTRLAAALDLPSDSNAAAILSAFLAALLPGQKIASATATERPDPARFVPIDAVRDLLSDRSTRIATMRESEATARVDSALRAGHITPAMRDWATALCMQDVTSFDTFISKSPAPFAHLHRELLSGLLPGHRAETAIASQDEAAICAQLGLKPDALRN